MNVKVSIIIPVYNMKKYLAECLNSVVNQTLSEIEIIVVNDGSTDNSENIIKEFVSKYPNINYYWQENAGVSSARNKGIENAKGEYLYFLDSDDTIGSDFLESCYDMAKRENADFVICGDADWQQGLETPPCVWCASIFVKKSLVENYNLKFPEKIQPCEDGLFSHFAFALADKVVQNKDVKYFYRQHEESNNSKIQSDIIFEQLPKWLESLEEFYNQYNLWDKKALHLAMFLQKEPFARFKNYSFNLKHQKILYEKLKTFYKNHVESGINNENFVLFNNDFKKFAKSKDFTEYFIKSYFAMNNLFSLKNEYCNGKKYKTFTFLGFENTIEIKGKGEK